MKALSSSLIDDVIMTSTINLNCLLSNSNGSYWINRITSLLSMQTFVNENDLKTYISLAEVGKASSEQVNIVVDFSSFAHSCFTLELEKYCDYIFIKQELESFLSVCKESKLHLDFVFDGIPENSKIHTILKRDLIRIKEIKELACNNYVGEYFSMSVDVFMSVMEKHPEFSDTVSSPLA